MKALVISGGGSKGAFAGGIAEYLINVEKHQYDLYVGTSVGSLITSQLALNKLSELKKTFTSISNKDIFSISPFRIKTNKNGAIEISINHFNSLRAFIRRAYTFGESKSLHLLIKSMISEQEFNHIKKQSRMIFTVSNLTTQKTVYIDSKDTEYIDFIDYLWASANIVPFMSLLNKNNCQYADGGFGMHIPVFHAIEQGATEIHVINLKSDMEDTAPQKLKNPFQSLMGVFNFMANQIGLKDMLIGKLKGRQKQIDVKIWSPKEHITNNSLYFNPELMNKWWEDGYLFAKNKKPICHCFLPNGEIMEF